MESQPEEFYFGLPDEVAQVFEQEIDDWDEWQLEDMLIAAQFAIEERQAAAAAAPSWTDEQSLLTAFISQGEMEPWGIDEPLTEADLAWLDEGWPEET
jgi:hypothetical protein